MEIKQVMQRFGDKQQTHKDSFLWKLLLLKEEPFLHIQIE